MKQVVKEVRGLMEAAYGDSASDRKELDRITHDTEAEGGDPVGEAEVRADAASGIAMSILDSGGRTQSDMLEQIKNTSVFRSAALRRFLSTRAAENRFFAQYVLAVEALRSCCIAALTADFEDPS